MNVSADIYEYLTTTDIEKIAEAMREAISERYGYFLEVSLTTAQIWTVYSVLLRIQLRNTDQVYSLDTLQNELRTPQQGVDAGTVKTHVVELWVCSFYLAQGLQTQVFSIHLSSICRSHDQYKALYTAMGAPGVRVRVVRRLMGVL